MGVPTIEPEPGTIVDLDRLWYLGGTAPLCHWEGTGLSIFPVPIPEWYSIRH